MRLGLGRLETLKKMYTEYKLWNPICTHSYSLCVYRCGTISGASQGLCCLYIEPLFQKTAPDFIALVRLHYSSHMQSTALSFPSIPCFPLFERYPWDLSLCVCLHVVLPDLYSMLPSTAQEEGSLCCSGSHFTTLIPLNVLLLICLSHIIQTVYPFEAKLWLCAV